MDGGGHVFDCIGYGEGYFIIDQADVYHLIGLDG